MSQINVWLRSKEKIFLIILCGLLMVAFGAGPSVLSFFGRSRIKGGAIFGKKVSGKKVVDLARGLSMHMGQQRISSDDLMALAWQTLIYEEEAARHGIHVGEVDLIRELARRFQTQNGDFDNTAYRVFLKRNQINQSLYENTLLRLTAVQKLQTLVADSVVMSPEEAWLWFSREQQKVKTGYLRLLANDLTSLVTLDEPSTEAFYKEHRDKARGTGPFGAGYQTPENIKIEYVMARYDDYAKAAEIASDQIKVYYEEHKEDYVIKPAPKEDAEKPAAPEKTEAPNAPEEEEPSYKPLEDVAESIEKILRDEAGKKAVEEAMVKVNNAIYEAFDAAGDGEEETVIDLAAIAKRFNITYRETDFFSADKAETLLPGATRFAATAFGQGMQGIETTSVVIDATEGKFLFRTLELQPARPAEYEKVKTAVAGHLRLKKASELALEVAGSAATAENLDAAAAIVNAAIATLIEDASALADKKNASEYFTVGETKLFGRPIQVGMYNRPEPDYGTGLPGNFDCKMFAENAFSLKDGETGMAYDSEDARVIYLLQRNETVFPDRNAFELQKKWLLPQLRTNKQREAIVAWQEDVRRRAQPSEDVMKFLGRLDGWGG